VIGNRDAESKENTQPANDNEEAAPQDSCGAAWFLASVGLFVWCQALELLEIIIVVHVK
jgi:hypothetical protein